MTKPGKNTCAGCRYWNRAKRASWTDVAHGGKSYVIEHAQCRRYAPARLDRQLGIQESVWPHVNANDWCGDFARLDPQSRAAGAETPPET